MTLALLLALIPARADDRCAIDLPRDPRVVAAIDFSPLPTTCDRFGPDACRVIVSPDADAPAFATYRLACARIETPPAPPPPTEDPRLTALKRGRWIEAVNILVPEGSFCTSHDQVRRMIEADHPELAVARETPRESEPRVRVWSVSVDESGYVKLTAPDVIEALFGREEGAIPEEVCRGSVEVDGRSVTPKTRNILATCRGVTPPDVNGGCDDPRGPIHSDLRRLTVGLEQDPGARHLAALAAADDEVEALEKAGPPPAPPAPPTRRYQCTEAPKPVPLQNMLAVWSGSRRVLRRAAEQLGSGSCTTAATDLDPQGLIFDLVARFWQDEAELATLRQLWELDPNLGRALLTALDEAVGRNPALRSDDLHRIARAALEAPRGFRPRDVAAVEAERKRLLSRIAEGEPVLDRIPTAAAAARADYDLLRATLARWPPHARERMDELHDRREQISRALRDPNVPRRRAGKSLVLELYAMRRRIGDDPFHEVLVELRDIGEALEGDGEALVRFCRDALDEARAAVPPPTTLEEALADAETFRSRRDAIAEAHRRLDREPCARAELHAGHLEQRVRNLETESERVDPDHPDHPTRDEADRLLRRSDTWLRKARR